MAKYDILGFIDDIPDDKLENLADSTEGTIRSNEDMRLDMICVTRNGHWNIVVMANRRAKTKSIRRAASNKKGVDQKIAGPILVPKNADFTPEQIRNRLKENILVPAQQGE